jgi:UDP-N-acetylglucosamine 2-epimerase (non-hydrolysing)
MTQRIINLLLVAGARPNFMKIAPLIRAIRARDEAPRQDQPRIKYRLVHTGQHYDQRMSEVFFSELGIPTPDINLGVGSGSHAVQTAGVMTSFEPVCLEEKPEWVVVVGDVNSSMACTLVASKLGIKVAHIEAGLRSFDRSMPEEINRIVTDALADLLLTPSVDAGENLRREGVDECRIRLVGNIMIDALVANLEKARLSELPKQMGLHPRCYAYVTLHRPSNVDERHSLTTVVAELRRLARTMPVVFPMHPRTRKMCAQFGISLENAGGFHVLDPIGYHDSLCLTEHARLVLTDSGGLQEESTYLRTPCLTLRPNTERPVTITMGSNRLTSLGTLAADIEELLSSPAKRGEVPPLWDGCSAGRILNCLIAATPNQG